MRILSALHNELSGSAEGDRNEGSRDEARMVEPWLQDNRINDLKVEQGLDILQLLNTNYEGLSVFVYRGCSLLRTDMIIVTMGHHHCVFHLPFSVQRLAIVALNVYCLDKLPQLCYLYIIIPRRPTTACVDDNHSVGLGDDLDIDKWMFGVYIVEFFDQEGAGCQLSGLERR